MEKENQIFLGEFEVGLKEQHKTTHNEIKTQDINSVLFGFKLTKEGESKADIDHISLLIVLPTGTKVILRGTYNVEKEMYITEYFDTSIITNRSKQRAFGYVYGELETEEGTKGYDIGSFSFFVGTSALDKTLEDAESVYVPRFEDLYNELKTLGIHDAPNDSEPYARKNESWEKITDLTGGVSAAEVKEIATEVTGEIIEDLDLKDGVSPIVDVAPIPAGTKVTITDKNGPKSMDILNGARGDKGNAGDSAYQIWLDAGHKGSEEDFLAWLKSESSNIQSGRVYLFGHFPEGLRGIINFPEEFKEIPVVAPVYQGDGALGILPIVQAYGVTTTGFNFLVQDVSGDNNYNAFMNWVAIGS